MIDSLRQRVQLDIPADGLEQEFVTWLGRVGRMCRMNAQSTLNDLVSVLDRVNDFGIDKYEVLHISIP